MQDQGITCSEPGSQSDHQEQHLFALQSSSCFYTVYDSSLLDTERTPEGSRMSDWVLNYFSSKYICVM